MMAVGLVADFDLSCTSAGGLERRHQAGLAGLRIVRFLLRIELRLTFHNVRVTLSLGRGPEWPTGGRWQVELARRRRRTGRGRPWQCGGHAKPADVPRAACALTLWVMSRILPRNWARRIPRPARVLTAGKRRRGQISQGSQPCTLSSRPAASSIVWRPRTS